MNILFLIRSLGIGGAERQICTLARGLVRSGDHVTLATYSDGAASFDLAGVRRVSLGKRGRYDVVTAWRALRRELRDGRYDVLHSYMPTANILAALAAGRQLPVVFGVRATRQGQEAYGWRNRALLGLELRLAGRAALVISNSEAASGELGRLGLDETRLAVVPNGIDVDRFRPDQKARACLRRAWDVPQDALLIGRVGRIDPMKDLETGIRAFACSKTRNDGAHLVIVGNGDATEIARLRRVAESLGLANVHFRPAMTDPAPLYAALDILVSSSSFGEGFPNVVAEAMAAGAVPVVTDVGDAALLARGIGRVVPPGQASLLGEAIDCAARGLRMRGGAVRQAARTRIVDNYGEALLVERTRQLLKAAVEKRA